MIEQWLVTIITFLIGYYLGTKRQVKKDAIRIWQELKEDAEKVLPKSDLQPGIIRRPTAKQLYARNEDEKTKEGKQAMKITLDELIPKI